ncbi:hypothetical protein HK102_002554 [Quaeritorhiza haematococci]|nr:hypothetical protein HK102_002554 [Quaeritorhiza haematococci]
MPSNGTKYTVHRLDDGSPFSTLAELASESVGGKVLFATDDFFAVAENMIKRGEPVWDESRYTEFGKWMDGWETRRKRTAGHDWCILKLGPSSMSSSSGESGGVVIKGVEVDTAFFTGNHVPKFSIQAALLDGKAVSHLPPRRSQMGSKATQQELDAANLLKSDQWEDIVPMTELKPGYPATRRNWFKIEGEEKRWTHLRINMFPDGGIARLRVYGHVVRDWSKVPRDAVVDLAAMENGGRALSWSNEHFGKPRNLIMPNRGEGMYDGWETARNPNRPPIFKHGPDGHLIIPGHEWCILKLGKPGVIGEVEVDTNHFKGNYPESCLIEGCHYLHPDDTPFLPNTTSSPPSSSPPKKRPTPAASASTPEWFTLVPRTRLEAHKQHHFKVAPGNEGEKEAKEGKVVTHVRLTIYPDGGVSRVRVLGRVAGTEEGNISPSAKKVRVE